MQIVRAIGIVIGGLVATTGTVWGQDAGGFLSLADRQQIESAIAGGRIDEAQGERLLFLLDHPLDLRTATILELLELPNIGMPQAVELAMLQQVTGDTGALPDLTGALSFRHWRAIQPFVSMGQSDTGMVRLRAAGMFGDRRVPPTAIDAGWRHVAGIRLDASAVLSRDRFGPPRYDVAADQLNVQSQRVRLERPDVYGELERNGWTIGGGTFRAGFADGLVFDNSGLRFPDGFYPDTVATRDVSSGRRCDLVAGANGAEPCSEPGKYGIKDFRTPTGHRGAFVDSQFGKTIPGRVAVFGGWYRLRLSQYGLYDKERCVDPRATSIECDPPDVEVTDIAGGSHVNGATLDDVFGLGWGGARLEVQATSRWQVGLTGWGGRPRWLIAGMESGFQEWIRFPDRAAFGAVGGDVTYRSRQITTGLEAGFVPGSPGSRFDTAAASGFVRSGWGVHGLGVDLRVLGTEFDNPYSSPYAQADQFEGNRARDEIGIRPAYSWDVSRASVDVIADVWRRPMLSIWRSQFDSDITVRILDPGFWIGARTSVRDNRIGAGFWGCSFDSSGECDPDRVDVEPYIDVDLTESSRMSVAWRQRWFGDGGSPTSGGRLAADGQWQTGPAGWTGVIQYNVEDLSDRARLEESVLLALALSTRPVRQLSVNIDIRQKFWLSAGDRRVDRNPNPETSLWLDFESRF